MLINFYIMEQEKMAPKQIISTLTLITLLFLTASASAKYITLTHSLSMEKIVSREEAQFNISVSNLGDEPAYDVSLSILGPPGMSSTPVYLGRVDPNIPVRDSFNVSLAPDMLPGAYSFAIRTEYKDANGYPFSSVSPYSMFVRGIQTTQVAGLISEASVGTKEKAKITLDIRNMDDKPHELTISFFSPKELKITPEKQKISVGPRSESRVEFEVQPFGALAGSSYIIFASMDYEENGIHYSSTAHGLIKIVEKKDDFGFGGWLPFAVVLVLVIIAVVYQFKK